jgi:hypothetical protein
VLAVLILSLEAHIHPALIAAVGCLLQALEACLLGLDGALLAKPGGDIETVAGGRYPNLVHSDLLSG